MSKNSSKIILYALLGVVAAIALFYFILFMTC